MNQMYRNRIWDMVFRNLADKVKLQMSKDHENRKQIVDPDEIIREFKESIQKSICG